MGTGRLARSGHERGPHERGPKHIVGRHGEILALRRFEGAVHMMLCTVVRIVLLLTGLELSCGVRGGCLALWDPKACGWERFVVVASEERGGGIQ